MTQEVNTELTNDCTTLTVHTLNVQPADWGTGIPSGVASALTADPGINYVLPNYDSEASLAQAGITQAGKKAGSAAATWVLLLSMEHPAQWRWFRMEQWP